MGFLTTQEIIKKNTQLSSVGSCLVTPFKEERVESACYELGLGGKHFVSEANAEIKEKKDKEIITIPPGQMAFLETSESVNIPKNMLAFISIKATQKLKGLVNISGFHVDPGYSGKLLFSVFNSSPFKIDLEVGTRFFLIWFCELSENDDKFYDKMPKGLEPILVKDIKDEFPSNGLLANDLKNLKTDLDSLKKMIYWLGGVVIVPMFLVLLQFTIQNIVEWASDRKTTLKETIIKSKIIESSSKEVQASKEKEIHLKK